MKNVHVKKFEVEMMTGEKKKDETEIETEIEIDGTEIVEGIEKEITEIETKTIEIEIETKGEGQETVMTELEVGIEITGIDLEIGTVEEIAVELVIEVGAEKKEKIKILKLMESGMKVKKKQLTNG